MSVVIDNHHEAQTAEADRNVEHFGDFILLEAAEEWQFDHTGLHVDPIPFADLTSRNVRPAIIVGRKGTDLFLVPSRRFCSVAARDALHAAWPMLAFVPFYLLQAGLLMTPLWGECSG